MFYSEKKTEDFLEKNKFKVVTGAFVSNEKELENALKRFNFPVVMKVSGEKIVHKNILGGIVINIKEKRTALEAFGRLKIIKYFEGVVIQEQVNGKEVLIGIKKTKDFGHAVCVGSGGINAEKLNDVSFRIFPFDNKEAKKMLSEIKISKKLSNEEKTLVEENIMNVCGLIKKNLGISELDINPLMVNGSQAVVVDARMVLD